MTAKTKTFDCVEMKNRIQAERMAEYKSRKNEFPSFLGFVRSRTHDSDWLKQVRGKFGWGE